MKEYRYVIISPVKDEQDYIEETLKSVTGQTVLPSKWLLVDDGSKDETPYIINQYCSKFHWIHRLRLNRNGVRHFPAEIQAFNKGFEMIKDEKFDFIVKLDCDLSFGPNYFEQLLSRFKEDRSLGIASGIYLEQKKNRWVPIKMPDYHTTGACKVVRAECFRDIGGFINSRGWDTIDEIRAQMKGWRTKHFSDLEIYHLRNEGSGIGHLKANAMHGEIYYTMKGGILFFCLKAAHRIATGRPMILSGFMMIYGYLKAMILRRKMLVTEEEARFYKNLLHNRIKNRVRPLLNFGNWKIT